MARKIGDDGATPLEYGLVAGVLAIAVVAGASLLGERIDGSLGEVTGSISNSARKQDRGVFVVDDAGATQTQKR